MLYLLSWINLGPAKPHEDLFVCILEEGKVGPGVMHVNLVKKKHVPGRVKGCRFIGLQINASFLRSIPKQCPRPQDYYGFGQYQ